MSPTDVLPTVQGDDGPIEANPVILIGTDGLPYAASSSAGGDATAANQSTQITAEQAIQALLGAISASPTANTVQDRLKTLATLLAAATPAGELHAMQVGGEANVWQPADASLTRPANATAYAARQAIGASGSTLFTFTNFFRKNANTGLLTGMRLTASVASIAVTNMGAVRAHLYHTSPTSPPASDQAQFVMLNSNTLIKIGYVDFSTWITGGTGSDIIESYGTPVVPNMPVKAAAAARNLYCLLEANGAFTPIASSIIMPYASAALD